MLYLEKYNQFMHNDILSIELREDDHYIYWYVSGKKVGHLYFQDIENDIVSIIFYSKFPIYDRINHIKHDIELKQGVGYELIKMSINKLLSLYNGVFSLDNNRNEYSNHVWQKLSNEYDVENIKIGNKIGKIIYSKNKREN